MVLILSLAAPTHSRSMRALRFDVIWETGDDCRNGDVKARSLRALIWRKSNVRPPTEWRECANCGYSPTAWRKGPITPSCRSHPPKIDRSWPFCALRLFIDWWRWEGAPFFSALANISRKRIPRFWLTLSRRLSRCSRTPRRNLYKAGDDGLVGSHKIGAQHSVRTALGGSAITVNSPRQRYGNAVTFCSTKMRSESRLRLGPRAGGDHGKRRVISPEHAPSAVLVRLRQGRRRNLRRWRPCGDDPRLEGRKFHRSLRGL